MYYKIPETFIVSISRNNNVWKVDEFLSPFLMGKKEKKF